MCLFTARIFKTSGLKQTEPVLYNFFQLEFVFMKKKKADVKSGSEISQTKTETKNPITLGQSRIALMTHLEMTKSAAAQPVNQSYKNIEQCCSGPPIPTRYKKSLVKKFTKATF